MNSQIAAEPDPAARAVMTYHRNMIVEAVEIGMLRQAAVAEDDAEPPSTIARLNGWMQ